MLTKRESQSLLSQLDQLANGRWNPSDLVYRAHPDGSGGRVEGHPFERFRFPGQSEHIGAKLVNLIRTRAANYNDLVVFSSGATMPQSRLLEFEILLRPSIVFDAEYPAIV